MIVVIMAKLMVFIIAILCYNFIMKYLAVLGRQPKISLAELESLFSNVQFFGGNLALFDSDKKPEIARLGGTVKLARPLTMSPEKYLLGLGFDGKFVIGVSDYSKGASGRKSQMLALKIKRVLKREDRSVRVLENRTADLSTATVFHNQLGEKPGHFELIKYNGTWYIGIGVQNINAYRDRDQNRPARDAKNGMLPPKLAQILINLCGDLAPGSTILDPFCGTGVVLQEAMLMGYKGYGTDVSERIVGFAEKNLSWLTESSNTTPSGIPARAESKALKGVDFRLTLRGIVPDRSVFKLSVGDAQNFIWEQPIDAVTFEGYLGPPMSQPPVEIKLKTVISEIKPLYCNVLKNLSSQLKSGVPVVMAIPAWLRPDGHYQRLNLLDEIGDMGYNVVKYNNLSQEDLLYFRDGQIVAREIIVLRKK